MRRFAAVIMIALVFCLAGCSSGSSGTSSGKASTTPSTNQAAGQNAQSSALPDRAGFGGEGSQPVNVMGVEFQLPGYYAQGSSSSSSMLFQGSDANGNKEDVFVICVTNESSKAANVDTLQSKKDSMISSLYGQKAFKDVKVVNSADGGVADLPSGVYTVTGKLENNGKDVAFNAKSAIFLNSNLQVGLISLVQCNTAKNDYFPDFDKVLASATVLQQESGEQASAGQADGVSPSLKDALDSYEAFMDEYIEFMQKYKDSSDVASMMNDYLSYMKKYSELVGKINAMDTKNMSAADAAYYLEVTSRVSQKLLNAAV